MESPLTAPIFTTSINQTEEQNKTCEVPLKEVFIFSYSLLFPFSLVLNCITMHVYFCTNHLVESSIMVYMKNLATADFFLCLRLTLDIASYANSSATMFKISCSFGAIAFYINMYASMFFMGLIALNRYLKITRPMDACFLQSVRAARYISAVIWFSLLLVSFIFLILFLKTSWGKQYDQIFCETIHSPKVTITYMFILSLTTVIFICVLVSLIFLYWKTLQKLRQIQNSAQIEFCSEKFRKSQRNMLLLVVIFCACFLPYHVMKPFYVFIRPLVKECAQKQILYMMNEVTFLFVTMNAFLDPLIYFFFCKTFRDQFKRQDGLCIFVSKILSWFASVPCLKKWVQKD